MGLLANLDLDSVLTIHFTPPKLLEKWFSKYKGGQIEFVLNERYEEPGGYDWILIEKENLFLKFSFLRPFVDEMEGRGNRVEFSMPFCRLSIKFLNVKEAVWFRMKL